MFERLSADRERRSRMDDRTVTVAVLLFLIRSPCLLPHLLRRPRRQQRPPPLATVHGPVTPANLHRLRPASLLPPPRNASTISGMSYGNLGSLTPSRPAPPAPQRRATDNALANVGYNISLSSSSSYAPSYSGIGGSPNRNSDAGHGPGIVRNTTVSVKEDGFASFLWRPKWLVLREHTLSFHKNEVRASALLSPRGI